MTVGPTPSYEVYALRYATLRNRRARDVFIGGELPEQDDRVLDMACYFWLIRDRSRVVLLDCGWDREVGLPRGPHRYDHDPGEDLDPVELLARFGESPDSVDHVVVSHMHIDHIGNLDLFAHATFTVARAEYDYWTGPEADRSALGSMVVPSEVRVVRDLVRSGRVHLLDRVEEILPGITLTVVGGHSPGQMITEVKTAVGTVVLASDAVHYHEELEHDRPFYVFADLPAMVRGYELLRQKTAPADTWLVSGHDPAEMERFEPYDEDCLDLTRPVR
jgi:glyoxylase-like metal-dependent hydrolase (beta-lactamase superfamily II)